MLLYNKQYNVNVSNLFFAIHSKNTSKQCIFLLLKFRKYLIQFLLFTLFSLFFLLIAGFYHDFFASLNSHDGFILTILIFFVISFLTIYSYNFYKKFIVAKTIFEYWELRFPLFKLDNKNLAIVISIVEDFHLNHNFKESDFERIFIERISHD